MTGRADVVVVGGGPAGLAAAAALADAGLAPVLVAPAGSERWPSTYGLWVDEVPDGARPPLARRWDRVVVDLGEEAPRVLPAAYGLVDNEALRDALVERLHAGGGRLEVGRVRGVRAGPDTVEVDVSSGPIRAAVVVDASGHRPALTRFRSAGPGPAVQVAYGLVGRFARPPAEPGAATLMDWRPAVPGPAGWRDPSPSFLYALDLGDGRWLAEETSLAGRPPRRLDDLEERLRRRLSRLRAEPVAVEAVERVAIPMGGGLPVARAGVVPFGAAARAVHPASGYHVAGALRAAPRLAEALGGAVGARRPAAAAAAAGRVAVWPASTVRRRGLYRYGLEVLLRLDQGGTARFFGAFFDLPRDRWFGFLTDTTEVPALLATMGAMFRGASPDVRGRLLTPAGTRAGARLLVDAVRGSG